MVINQEYLQILRGQYKQVWFSPFEADSRLKTSYSIGFRINISSYGDLYHFSLIEVSYLDSNDIKVTDRINYVVTKTPTPLNPLCVMHFIYKNILT